MIPYRFGAPDRRMFGVFHPPAGERARGSAVLLLNPFGQEAIRSHRIFRVLAERLARRGFPVLRFDYYATGDSDGECTEGTLAGWCEDVRTAHAELLARSGCRSASWIGLRLGASVGLLAARDGAAPRMLLLWDPVIDGGAYLDELRLAHMNFLAEDFGVDWPTFAARFGRPREGVVDEALGFPLPLELRAELRAMELGASPPPAAHVHVLVTAEGDAQRRLRERLAVKPSLDWRVLASSSPWNSDEAMSAAIVPADVLDHIEATAEALP